MQTAHCLLPTAYSRTMFSPDAKEQVRQAIDIVDWWAATCSCAGRGRNYVGLCPWHDDSRPSLQVNPERQSFKCWVCDIGGDVFSFVMRMRGPRVPRSAGDAGRAGGHHAQQRAAGRAAAGAAASSDKRTLLAAHGLGRGAVSPLSA